MSAALHLATNLPPAPPEEGVRVLPSQTQPLIPIADAAELLGLNRAHLARVCRDKYQPAGLAVLAVPPEGGSPTWYVSRRIDPRLAVVLGDDYQVPDLSVFTISQREQAHQKVACVDAYRKARATDTRPQSDWMPVLVKQLEQHYPKLKISERSLRRWYSVYQRPADIIHLIPAKGGDRMRGASPEAWAFFQSIYLDERRPSVRTCWKRARDEAKFKGWRWTSYEQCRRQLNDRVPPDTQLQFRNPRAWRWKHEPYIGQDPEAHAAGLCWVGDHSQLDLICTYGGKLVRPWVTTWMDWRTRKIAGWTMSVSPDSTTIMAALRHGLLDPSNFGGPDLTHIDNGRDYDSYVFHGQTKKMRKQSIGEQVHVDESGFKGVLGMLGIEAHFSLPYRPNGKSRQERFYGTMHDQFDKTFLTYTGANTADKPESLNAILKHPHKVPTFEAVRDRFAKYVEGYNADADHSRADMKGLSPDEALAQWCPRKKVMADESALRLLLQHWSQPISVGRNGVRISPLGKGFSYGQFNPSLRAYKGTGKKVMVAYDPHDIREVQIFDVAGRYVTTAMMNSLSGMATSDPIGREQVGELIRRQRRYRKSKRDVAANSRHEYLSDAELLAAMQREKPATKPERERPLKIHQTPLDGQAKAIESDSFHQAAGGEHAPKPKPVFHYKSPRGGYGESDEDVTSRGMPDITKFLQGCSTERRIEPDPEDVIDPFAVLFGKDAETGTDDGEFKPYKLTGGDN